MFEQLLSSAIFIFDPALMKENTWNGKMMPSCLNC